MEPVVVVLFDGECGLCSGAARWLVARDRRAVMRFAGLKSRAGRRVLSEAGCDGAMPDSMVVVEGARVLVKSDAALRVAMVIGFPWSVACVGAVLPRVVRDWVYDVVARNRKRFGSGVCAMPSGAARERYLDADESGSERGSEG
jgi:predicted DCC family thiol-disulfide oxidoreductase YuxK